MTSDKNDTDCSLKTCHADHDRNLSDIDLSSPFKIRDVTFRNRIVCSPMCQYIAKNGFADDWHLVHLGSRAAGGAGLVFTEATAITPEGRISPGDLGLWSDDHIEPLAKIAHFITSQGSVPGIQLAHAGRKGSCLEPWNNAGSYIPVKEGGWPILAPSPIAFQPENEPPKEATKEDIKEIISLFVKAAIRAIKAGFKVIEIHSAHGYLLHSFLSPLSNKRVDEYGGSFDNRIRLLIEVTKEVRKNIPIGIPLFVRISATDWAEGGWDLEQSIELANVLKPLGVDLIDVSSGGLVPHAKIPLKEGYQVPFAASIREKSLIHTGAVGLITKTQFANEVIQSQAADLVFIGREFLRNPYFALQAEKDMDKAAHWPLPYGYAVNRSR